MAKPRKPKNSLSNAELKAFRHKVSELKKLGGVSKRVDARKQRPTRYMTSKVRKLEPVLTGDAVLVARKKLRPDLLADYERTHRRMGSKVLIPKERTEKLHVRKGLPEFERLIADTGERRVVQKRIPLPIDIENVDDFIADLRRNPERWAAKRGPYPPWLFGFKIAGGRSRALFESPELMADDIERYQEVFEAFWDTFELVAIDQHRYGPWNSVQARKARGQGKSRRRGKRKPPHAGKLAEYAAKKREYRRNMSEGKREAIRERQRSRMAKKREDQTYRAKERAKDKVYQNDIRRMLGMKERPKK